MPAFTFTEDELGQLKKMAERLMEARKNHSIKEWRKPQNKAVKTFCEKFPPKEVFDAGTLYILDRVSMKIIRDLARAGADALDNRIIPEYMERMHKFPDKTEYYKPYLEKAQKMASLYKSLIQKVEEKL